MCAPGRLLPPKRDELETDSVSLAAGPGGGRPVRCPNFGFGGGGCGALWFGLSMGFIALVNRCMRKRRRRVLEFIAQHMLSLLLLEAKRSFAPKFFRFLFYKKNACLARSYD